MGCLRGVDRCAPLRPLAVRSGVCGNDCKAALRAVTGSIGAPDRSRGGAQERMGSSIVRDLKAHVAPDGRSYRITTVRSGFS